MANTIRHKRGTTKPTSSDLATGEIGINTLEGKLFTENDSGFVFEAGELLGAFSSSTITYTVTVASKTSAHRYNGTGSSNGYKINGVFSPFLNLAPGNTYKFDQADSSNSGHPLRFYLEADKSTAYTTNVTTSGTPGSSGAYTLIVIADTTPLVLHYQCSAHAHMGNSLLTNSKTVNYNDLQNQPSLFDGNYNSLSNRPTIPTATSDLTNDSGFITSASSTDVVSDTSPQLGGDLASNGSDIKFADDDKAIFGTGTGNDMEIFHESTSNTNEIIAADGDIHIQCDDFMVISDSTAGRSIYVDEGNSRLELGFDGHANAYFSGTGGIEFIKDVKFDGATAGRDIVFDRSDDALDFADNAKAIFGTGEDLQIYHDGNHSRISDQGTGYLVLETSRLQVNNAAGNEEIIVGIEGGAVELFHANSKKFDTVSGGTRIFGYLSMQGSGGHIYLPDSAELKVGNGEDLKIFHDGSNSYIKDSGTGNLFVHSSQFEVLNAAASQYMLRCIGGASVELYEAGDKKLETSSSGVSVTGNIVVSGTVDGRDLATDGSKLDGIAANATNVTNNNQISNGAGYITSASLSGVSDGGNAASLDGIDSTQFVRSDQDDTLTGIYTISQNNSTKLILNGNDDSRIYFHESGTDRGYIGWDAGEDGYWIWNNQQGKGFLLNSTPKWYDGTGYGTVWHSRNDGSGSGLDSDTVDGIQASSFVRSDASDTLTGSTYTFNSSTDQKIILSGSSNPYIRFQEGTTNKAYIQWNASGYFDLVNQETSDNIRIGGGSNGLQWLYDGNTGTIWHSGNDGAGSGLDADTLDGRDSNVSASNNTVVVRHSSGYIFANYFNTTPNTVSSGVTQICVETGNDGYIRHGTAAAVRSFLNVADGATAGGGYGSGDNASFNQLDITGAHGIDNEGWYRNDDSGEGMYNSSTGQHWYSDHDDYWNVAGGGSANSIRFRDEHAGTVRGYVYANNANQIGFLDQGGSWSLKTERDASTCTLHDQHFITSSNGSYDLGSSSSRWRNVYTSDLDLSNEVKGGNDVDGTWGAYTIQEGEESLFLLNRRNGKKYKFNLTEVS